MYPLALLAFCAAVMVPSHGLRAESFRDWRAECRGDGRDCVLATNVTDGRNALLAGLVVTPSADGRAGEMQIIVPPGVHLASGLFIAIGRGPPLAAPFQRCSPEGCLAQLSLDAQALSALRRASRAEIIYRPRSTTAPIRFHASLMGFSAALAHLLENRSDAS